MINFWFFEDWLKPWITAEDLLATSKHNVSFNGRFHACVSRVDGPHFNVANVHDTCGIHPNMDWCGDYDSLQPHGGNATSVSMFGPQDKGFVVLIPHQDRYDETPIRLDLVVVGHNGNRVVLTEQETDALISNMRLVQRYCNASGCNPQYLRVGVTYVSGRWSSAGYEETQDIEAIAQGLTFTKDGKQLTFQAISIEGSKTYWSPLIGTDSETFFYVDGVKTLARDAYDGNGHLNIDGKAYDLAMPLMLPSEIKVERGITEISTQLKDTYRPCLAMNRCTVPMTAAHLAFALDISYNMPEGRGIIDPAFYIGCGRYRDSTFQIGVDWAKSEHVNYWVNQAEMSRLKLLLQLLDTAKVSIAEAVDGLSANKALSERLNYIPRM